MLYPLSYARVAATEGLEPSPGLINSEVSYQLDDVASGTGLRVRAGVRRPMVPPIRLELTIPRRALALQASARPPAHRRQGGSRHEGERPSPAPRVSPPLTAFGSPAISSGSVGKVARTEGFEPPAGGFGDRCSCPLSYVRWLPAEDSNLAHLLQRQVSYR